MERLHGAPSRSASAERLREAISRSALTERLYETPATTERLPGAALLRTLPGASLWNAFVARLPRIPSHSTLIERGAAFPQRLRECLDGARETTPRSAVIHSFFAQRLYEAPSWGASRSAIPKRLQGVAFRSAIPRDVSQSVRATLSRSAFVERLRGAPSWARSKNTFDICFYKAVAERHRRLSAALVTSQSASLGRLSQALTRAPSWSAFEEHVPRAPSRSAS